VYPNQDVRAIVESLTREIGSVLEGNLEGLYLKGSLALGDFNSETSDVDLLVITRELVTNKDFTALTRMHGQIEKMPNRYASDIELTYISLDAIQNFRPGQEYPALERGQGEKLKWKLLGANWILEFWTVRERGITLLGPDPKTLIPPISAAEVVAATRQVVAEDWLEWVDTWAEPGWQTHAGELRFAVETMCRALYTAARSELPSKPKAVRWALETLPQPWSGLVAESQSWAAGGAAEHCVTAEVEAFVRWTAARLAPQS
jgi:predicted nucleotidyltransferase